MSREWRSFTFSALFLAVGAAHTAHAEPADGKNGLLLIVHGSSRPQWSEPFKKLDAELQDAVQMDGVFQEGVIAALEYDEPSVAGGVKILQDRGCKRIVAIPLFIARSGHVVYDVPTVMGVLSTPDLAETLREEGIDIADARVPIVLGPTLAEGDILLQTTLDRVKAISSDPANEALVIFAHGDPNLPKPWNEITRRTASYICGKMGITYADWAYVSVGQEYGRRGVPAIRDAAERRKRVLVVGLYVSLSPKTIHERWMVRDPRVKERFENIPEGAEVLFGDGAFLPDARACEWILQTARETFENRFGEMRISSAAVEK